MRISSVNGVRFRGTRDERCESPILDLVNDPWVYVSRALADEAGPLNYQSVAKSL